MIIALTGLAGSGKSTVAEMLNGVQIGFADPLKRFCGEVFGFSNEELYGPSEARERYSQVFTRPDGQPLTPRFALQTLGTEWGRNCDPDVWAKAGIARASWLEGNRIECPAMGPVVITDLRFVNEARLVREAGGEVWRIRRPGAWQTLKLEQMHPSEREVWSPEMTGYVTREINNAGTLEALRVAVSATLNR